ADTRLEEKREVLAVVYYNGTVFLEANVNF
ncbi:unnamed protein product, partial [Adineta steineri]